MLDGQRGPVRDVVLLNAGAGLFIAGRTPNVAEGVALAAAVIDDGRAAQVLARLVTLSNGAVEVEA